MTVPLPDVKGRAQILDVHAKNVRRGKDIDLNVIARGTPGFSGAELSNLVNIAALRAARENREAVAMADFEYAKDRILMGWVDRAASTLLLVPGSFPSPRRCSRARWRVVGGCDCLTRTPLVPGCSAERKMVMSEKNRKLTAYHEGGHALMAVVTKGSSPVHKATIVPRGQALGLVQRLPEDDEYSKTLEQLVADLDVAMGGRAAEELIFGGKEVTTGAASDLEHATRLARMMVTRWGFSDKLVRPGVRLRQGLD